MSKNQKPSMSKRRATVAAVLCFVAAIAIAGTYTFNDYRKTQKNELAKAEEKAKQDSEAAKETGTSGSSGQTGTQATAGKSHNINFTEDSYILWPVNGAVIMSYSMDKTVYFQTLDQYKYNPAVIIEGAEGDQVLCGAPGIVKSIDVSAQTGTTVNVDIGNGYELLYGQLKEVPVKVGDYVEAKSVLGYVSQPTKYYSKEGCNVYFEMRKDGQPVNPVEYTADQD